MARPDQLKMSTAERRRRKFSDNFKIQKVREIETGQTKVSEICSQYQVAYKNVYLWIDKFGSMKKDKGERMIVETQSDTRQLIELKKRISELERIIGQKQILIDFQDKMIELAEETYGVDIKKKFFSTPSSTSGQTGK
ncbi:transposase [Microbacter margulisiae]|uniref:Transposase-like protein n=1 Tax=Microbacter margulisiae TaxID=1350067 RepID=A0A7W5DNP1_9PORP|nr:transposase [Microbacter margulisiae]MBB3186106.1 transposase-like protein [Microbacter margulisiae]MBB3186974.1 transposase-like protein [Microbacter margulisiae]MBB3187184.1 transposase-like protein [Microbacter margulisiae]